MTWLDDWVVFVTLVTLAVFPRLALARGPRGRSRTDPGRVKTPGHPLTIALGILAIFIGLHRRTTLL